MLFLSYARNDDEPFVRKLHKDLTRHDVEVWWDRAAMESRGRTFLQEIRDAIEGSDRVLVVIGPAALRSDYVRVEWEHALLFYKGVLPLLRQGEFLSSITPDALRREISALHTVDFRSSRPYDEALTELLRLLHETVPPLAPFRTVVPALPPHFLPRLVDLDGLGALVLADVQRPVIITSAKQTTALQGMGGIGKSVLAAAFVRRAQVRRTFQDGIVWLRAGPRANPLECLRQAGYALGGAPEHYVSMEIAQVHIPGLLADKVCLLVLDDVWDVMQAAPLRSALGPRCRLLITTRDGSLVSSLGAQERRVDVLSEDVALALLADWSDQKTRELSEAHQVAQECGFLPFALALCGALARDGVPWADIRDALRAADLAFIKRQFPDYPYPDMLKAFQVSLEALERSSVCAAECYRELAVFSADNTVPEAAVVTLWLHKRPMKDREGRELLATLERKAMLNLSGQAPGRRVSLHDLQRDYLDGLALGRSDALHQRLLAAYAARCTNGWSTGPNDGYFFHRLAFHLVQGGRKMELHQLLLNFDWLQARLDATDAAGLIADYNYLLGNADLRVIQGALGLSAHVIAQDKTQLAGQLLGRLLPTAAIENQGLWQKMKDWLRRKQLTEQTQIPSLLHGVMQWKGSPWLRPLRGILSPPGGALLRTLTGHTDEVTVIAVTGDGQRAVSGSADRSLKLWDLEVGQELRTLTGHTGEVTAVAVTADGRRALSGSADRSLKLWDLEVGQELRTFTGHTDEVTAVAVTADGHWALSGSMDRTLKLWDLASGRELRTLSGHKHWVASIAISIDGQRVLSGSSRGGVRVWDLASGQQLSRVVEN